MKVKCPSCGASMSLDVLIAHDEAREALVAISGLSDELVKACLKYLTLFRPSEKDLTFARVAKLLGELRPMIEAQSISRNRQSYPAPREAWIWAMARCVEARDLGKLKTPLTSHGFLLENITFWTPEKTASSQPATIIGNSALSSDSKLRQGVAALAAWAGNDWLSQLIAQAFAEMATQNLQGRPAAQDLTVVAEVWRKKLAVKEMLRADLDTPRFQMAFAGLGALKEWPNVAALIERLPPRLMSRPQLEQPKADYKAQRAKLAEVKALLKQPKGASNE